ncbi:MAG: DUF126 domain-containing protein [Candidatus Thermoplasmatota archaeon]|nr:DUF126 domain-containing protein [Candidatus Thermoplasmatota archaeon]
MKIPMSSDGVEIDPDLVLKGVGLRGVGKGPVRGAVLFWDGPISFLGDVDPDTGMLTVGGRTMNISEKVLFFIGGTGSTVGSYVLYNLKLNGKAPRAIVVKKADAIITIGCILGDIPLVHKVSVEEWPQITGKKLAEVNSAEGVVKVWKDQQMIPG